MLTDKVPNNLIRRFMESDYSLLEQKMFNSFIPNSGTITGRWKASPDTIDEAEVKDINTESMTSTIYKPQQSFK
jgi:hypothetical protein